ETGVGLLLGNGDGTFQSAVSDDAAGGNEPAGYLEGRLCANGRPSLELVTIASDGRSVHGPTSALQRTNVYLGNADGTFQKPVFYRTPNVIGLGDPDPAVFREPLAVADFNGDGKLDIAVFNGPFLVDGPGFIVSVLLGNGDGTFQGAYSDYTNIGSNQL